MANNATNPVSMELTDRASFLLSQLGFHVARRFAELLDPLGLEPKQFGLLTHLAAADGQSQQQLADAIGIHRNVMVGLIDDLETKGLVQRRRHPSDRRAHAVHLTPTARRLLTPARHAVDELNAELLGVLDDGDQRVLLALLQRIARHAGLIPGVHPGLGQ